MSWFYQCFIRLKNVVLFSLVILCLICLTSSFYFGRADAVFRMLQGGLLLVDGPEKDIGMVATTDPIVVVFIVKNIGFNQVKIVGAETGCSCVTDLSKMPIAIDPAGSYSFACKLTPSAANSGQFEHRITVFTSYTHETLNLVIKGEWQPDLDGNPNPQKLDENELVPVPVSQL